MNQAFRWTISVAISAFAIGASAGWPLIAIRHTSAINDAPEVFARLMECHKRHPGACDEFWFSGGLRMTPEGAAAAAEKIAAFRPLCDETGIRLSYQQGLTLGHGVSHHGTPKPGEQEFPDDAWRIDVDGKRLGLLCPRSPFVLDYECDFAKAIIGTAKPDSYWLDDDLRLGAWKPQGCFCDRCIAAFNAKTGGMWTRGELAKRLFSDAARRDGSPHLDPLRAAWGEFNAESLALYAAAVRKAADELGSPCRLGYQAIWADSTYNGPDFRPLLEALSGPAHRPVGIRPGAGFYTEAEPRGMVEKCLSVAREAERVRECGALRSPSPQDAASLVASVCYEQETYPRHVLHKSPGAIMTECALALASGCNSLSLYWYDHAAPEPVGEYDRFVRTLAEARPYFERLAASTRRTRLGGVARFVGSAALEAPGFDLRDRKDFDLACAGIPVTVAGPGASAYYLTDKSRREMTEADVATCRDPIAGSRIVDVSDIEKYPLASRRAKLLDDLDAVTGGTFPVRIDACRPLRILPRVREDGRLDSVTILNLSIGGTDELKVRVRRPVSRNVLLQNSKMAVPVPLSCTSAATPDEVVVTLSDIPGWQIVTLFFGETNDVAAAKQDLAWRWYDGTDLPLEGRGFATASLPSPYCRLPSDMLPRVTKEVRELQADTAGLCFRFRTDSRRLRIFWKTTAPVRQSWNIASSGADGVDVYQETPQGWRFVQPPFQPKSKDEGAEYVWDVQPGLTTIVYLPTYNGIAAFRIGVEKGCSIGAAPPRRSGIAKPVVFYGTSITQGASASHPGGSWVARAARLADVEAVNLGFSGAGKMEDAMLDCLAKIDASLYVLDTVSNMSPKLTAERSENFVRRLVARRPGVPILLTANAWVLGPEARRRDAAVRDLVAKLKAEDPARWSSLHFAGDDTSALAPDADGTVDGIHLNDLGMQRAGDFFGGVIRDILEGGRP
ncbi:MAG: hypothetical protein IKH04_02195 [Kiritimatiellae bacterium]|nr:hypothetical protein [Kiritimatiellia bacterium]